MTERPPLGAAEAKARDAVRGLDRPAADAGFRTRLRQEFVSGTIASTAPACA